MQLPKLRVTGSNPAFRSLKEERPQGFSSCHIPQIHGDSLPVTLTISSGGDVGAVSLPGERSGKRSPEAAFVNRREQEEMPFGASPLVLFWSLRSGSDHVGPVRSGRAGAVGSADRSDRAGQGWSDRRAGQIRQGVHQSSSTSSYRWLPMPSCSA